MISNLSFISVGMDDRSFAVNMKYITEIEKTYEKVWSIKLRGCDDVVLLSYTYRQAFLRRIG